MKIAYYKKKGQQNGRADGRHLRVLWRKRNDSFSSDAYNIRVGRLDSLNCEIYQKEFDVYVGEYRSAFEDTVGHTYPFAPPL